MRPLVLAAFVTLDGVMQAPGGPDEDPTGGFTQGGWAVNYFDDAMNSAIMDQTFGRPFDLLVGRKTYEIFAAHWPHVLDEQRAERGGNASDIDDPVAVALNDARKYVASRTLGSVEWHNSVLLEGDVVAAVSALKGEDGPPIVTQGSSDLIQMLLAHDLIDEYRIWTFPIVVGSGKRLFGQGAMPTGLDLIDGQTSSTGVFMATYCRAGEIDLGSFEFDIPTDEERARRERLRAN
jgi:dihydrofolate reductase